MEDNSLFYDGAEIGLPGIEMIKKRLISYANSEHKPVFVLDKLLGATKSIEYDIDQVVYITVPEHPIAIIVPDNVSKNDKDNYLDDFKEDLGQLSSKYDYNKVLGRVRKWNEEWIRIYSISEFDIEAYLLETFKGVDVRKIDLIISIVIGSINDIQKVGDSLPTTTLDKVKHQIVLFDANQSDFIYGEKDKRIVRIQGLAGTGKTELLMHKLKNLYMKDGSAKIAFTCHNKVLAAEMRRRIEAFFNFMKVEEQIDWENRLKVFPSWGSNGYRNGMYSYICSYYGIPFLSFSDADRDFSNACEAAIRYLESFEKIDKCFDYIFIDESQDFKNSFFKLCELVCRGTVYIAGDIFQSIFDSMEGKNLNPDYLLDKCYRTDPRTLLFAHSIGMALLEDPPVNWLTDEEWKACGYELMRENSKVILSRRPLRRFENINVKDSIYFEQHNKEDYPEVIVNLIKQLKENNPTITPNDVGIIVIGSFSDVAACVNRISYRILKEFEWSSVKGYETKSKRNNAVFISNENNVKGLEFPFVICAVLDTIDRTISKRNSIYMALTRSFITSYLIISDDNDDTFVNAYKGAQHQIVETGKVSVLEPDENVVKKIKEKIKIQLSEKNNYQFLLDYLSEKYSEVDDMTKDYLLNMANGKWKNMTKNNLMNAVKRVVGQ